MLKQLAPLAAVLVVSSAFASTAAVSAQSPQRQPMPRTAAPAPADPFAAAKRLSVGDARKAVAEGKAVLVDVNSIGSYNMEHAKGSLSIPSNEIYARTAELPKNKQIIAYCSCSAEQTSARVALELQRQGFEAAALLGGLKAWKEAGYEVESKPAP